MLHLLITCKVYLDRARMYYGYAQMFAIITLLLNAINVPIKPLYFIVGVPIFLVVSVLIGWADKKLGFMEAEAQKLSNLNPTYSEIIERLDRIEKKPGYTIVTHPAMPPDKVIFFNNPLQNAASAILKGLNEDVLVANMHKFHKDPIDFANEAFKEWSKNNTQP